MSNKDMKTLDEYIEYLDGTIKMHDDLCDEITSDAVKNGLKQQSDDNVQLREWLTDYRKLKALKQNVWIPVKWHNTTEEEREREGYPEDWLTYLDCPMPDDGQEILITDKYGYVSIDTCYQDEGFSLDSGKDWIDDVVAWMPVPKPYKEET